MAANEEPRSGARAADRAVHVLDCFESVDPQRPGRSIDLHAELDRVRRKGAGMTLIVPLTRRRTVDLMRLASATCRG